MTTKKQREELKVALGEWVFEGLANEWTTTEILVQIAKDWRKVVGAGQATKPGGADLKGLAEWQGVVLDLLAVGTGAEFRAKQRVESANIVMSAFSGAGEDSIMGRFGMGVAEDVLYNRMSGRTEIMETYAGSSLV